MRLDWGWGTIIPVYHSSGPFVKPHPSSHALSPKSWYSLDFIVGGLEEGVSQKVWNTKGLWNC